MSKYPPFNNKEHYSPGDIVTYWGSYWYATRPVEPPFITWLQSGDVPGESDAWAPAPSKDILSGDAFLEEIWRATKYPASAYEMGVDVLGAFGLNLLSPKSGDASKGAASGNRLIAAANKLNKKRPKTAQKLLALGKKAVEKANVVSKGATATAKAPANKVSPLTSKPATSAAISSAKASVAATPKTTQSLATTSPAIRQAAAQVAVNVAKTTTSPTVRQAAVQVATTLHAPTATKALRMQHVMGADPVTPQMRAVSAVQENITWTANTNALAKAAEEENNVLTVVDQLTAANLNDLAGEGNDIAGEFDYLVTNIDPLQFFDNQPLFDDPSMTLASAVSQIVAEATAWEAKAKAALPTVNIPASSAPVAPGALAPGTPGAEPTPGTPGAPGTPASTNPLAPTIASVVNSMAVGNSTAGNYGDTITITGTNFTNVSAVDFNGFPAQFQISSPTLLIATVPQGAMTGPIHVSNTYGTAASPPFSILSFAPGAGAGGGSGGGGGGGGSSDGYDWDAEDPGASSTLSRFRNEGIDPFEEDGGSYADSGSYDDGSYDDSAPTDRRAALEDEDVEDAASEVADAEAAEVEADMSDAVREFRESGEDPFENDSFEGLGPSDYHFEAGDIFMPHQALQRTLDEKEAKDRAVVADFVSNTKTATPQPSPAVAQKLAASKKKLADLQRQAAALRAQKIARATTAATAAPTADALPSESDEGESL